MCHINILHITYTYVKDKPFQLTINFFFFFKSMCPYKGSDREGHIENTWNTSPKDNNLPARTQS